MVTASAGAFILGAWLVGFTAAAGLVTGWRVMVPSTAFGFLCAGLGLVAASGRDAGRPPVSLVVRTLALAAMVLPFATLLEYALGTRWGVESWLGVSFASAPPDPYAGRMSAVTSASFLLLGTGLAALTLPEPRGPAIVRLAGGAALTVSWLAVLSISFDTTRISDAPRFPGMAALTITLFAVASVGVITGSAPITRRLREADVDLVVSRWLVVATFAIPLALGRGQLVLNQWIDPGLSVALVTVAFALVMTMVAWRAAARMRLLQQQRQAALADLEARVAERTRELAAANAQLRAGEGRLHDAARRKDEFLATLAHELRNPLAPIRTGFQILKDARTAPDVRAHTHEVIDRQMGYLVRLIDDLLDVSRIAAGKLTLQQAPVEVAAFVHQAVEIVRTLVDRGRHQLVLDLPDDPLVVTGDATRLTQVVANLLQNATKYTPPGGRIEVVVRPAGAEVEVRVRDNGIGIPPEFLPRLFKTFSQLEPAVDRADGGLGLGLALVHAIVTLHRGTVEAHSDGPGRGSEFIVRLPHDGGTAAPTPAIAAGSSSDAG